MISRADQPNVKIGKWERGLYVESKELEKMRVFLWFYEWTLFDAIHRGQHKRGVWDNPVEVSEERGVIDAPSMRLEMSAGVDSADLRLTVTNKSDDEWPELAAIIPCFNPGPLENRNPLFSKGDTWFYGSTGLEPLERRDIHFNEKFRKKVDEQADEDGRYVWSSKWPKSEVDANPKSGLIVRQSTDGQWVTGIAWEDFLSCQGNNPWLCMHQSVRVGHLKPGQTKTIRGKIYLFRGSKEELLRRFRNDFNAR